ncbi:bifunctional protein-disulfide isomerase/oxidoreductase DsbC [Vibrio sp. S4M6]|uniref:bifunctional protein-disulfide isomerase/oxidoreductase DsbC n=1 Tax=Vibrio sinus TaxID=2946865 RepID=UPI00202AADFC|nr:bifunctional protein-disulfide isomerase/oxidoreductase DsbC [Vibrio sinus]MCL9781045.1 bifunctional protein-disulfide isomerase/oxidoreductase DsbC [Vibrio sinus]
MKVLRIAILCVLPFLVAVSHASESKPYQAKLIEQHVHSLGVKVLSIEPTGMNGLFQVNTTGGVIYSSADGKHVIAGTLYSMGKSGKYEDVLAKKQAPLNAEKIAKFKDKAIVFKAKDEKYVVTVFTDITCGYCVRLHKQIQEYNDLGITIDYLAFPRQGPQSPVADQMAAIWCAKDPKEAMHDAKTERRLPEKGDNFAQCQASVAEQYALGVQLGVKGTPAIFLPNGEMIGGYLPPKELLKRLQNQ